MVTNKEEMLLVELRFNYQNLKNLKKSDLEGKVRGSVALLPNNVIHTEYLFIFQPNLVAEARRRLARMNPVIPNNYKTMDLDKLKETYF